MTAESSYPARLDECRRELREAKVGLAVWLVVEVIFDYSFATGQAAAWIPSLEVFLLRTGMGKKEIGEALAKAESYGMVEWEPAPEAQFPQARLYKFFPRGTRCWSIAPRLPDRRLQQRASAIDRWLRSLNESGGPAQGNLFPERWDHADTLAEWAGSQSVTPQASPDRPVLFAAAQPSRFQPAPPDASAGIILERGLAPPETVGKNPTRGEKPHAPFNGVHGLDELNERHVSPFNSDQTLNEAVGKNHTETASTAAEEAEIEDASRPEHWPTREVENRLMRRLTEMLARFYAPPMAATVMAKYGGLWRWRLRQNVFCVEHSLDKADAQWSEIHKLGGWLNREWAKLWRKQQAARLTALDAREP